MKRRSPLATFVGAVPGALPALIGWTAAAGTASAGGWALFAIVFLWQIPHFMAIAWMFRDDYRRAGFPMLSVVDPTGSRAGREAVVWTAALLPVSVEPDLVWDFRDSLRVGCRRPRHGAAGAGDSFRLDAHGRIGPGALLRIDYLPAAALGGDDARSLTIHDLPAVNATLNAISGVLLVIGYLLIRAAASSCTGVS